MIVQNTHYHTLVIVIYLTLMIMINVESIENTLHKGNVFPTVAGI